MIKETWAIFTDVAGFGETVWIDGVAVSAIFDRESADDSGFGLTVSNADPQLIIADVDIPTDIMQAVIVARNVVYQASSVAFDGTGMSVIQLKRKNADEQTSPY